MLLKTDEATPHPLKLLTAEGYAPTEFVFYGEPPFPGRLVVMEDKLFRIVASDNGPGCPLYVVRA